MITKSFTNYAIYILIMVLCILSLSSCNRNIYGVFTKQQLKSYERIAVLGLNPEREQILMAAYTKAFPEQMITFVERKMLDKVINEQDLRQGRLNDNTRARIKQIFGVELLIICKYNDKLTRKKLLMRIIDSETGAIVGSVISEANINFESHCSAAIKALKDNLKKSKNNFPYADRRVNLPVP